MEPKTQEPKTQEPRTRRTQPRRSQTRDLRILNAIAEALNSAPNVQQALTQTLALVADLLGLQTGWVWLLDPETGAFSNAVAQNLPPYLQEPIRMAGHTCWCIDDFRKGRLTPMNIDVKACSRLCSAVENQPRKGSDPATLGAAESADNEGTRGLRYHASIPLTFQEKPLGIMNVTGPSWRRLTQDELRLLGTIAYQVGIAIERARLAETGVRLARAEERTRIAREIHDTLAQGLTAIALHIEGALHHLDSHPEKARERLERALTAAHESLEEARRSVLHLRAAPLVGKPLTEALSAFARAYTSETGIRTALRLLGAGDLPPRMEADLFRIAQEALTNVRRHARATSVAMALRADRDTVRLVIHDNGQGYDLQAASEGQGLVGMRERAKLLGGTCRLLSRAGRGTTVAVVVPRTEEAAP